MEKITRMIVEYENGQRDEFVGKGTMRRVDTSVTEEQWEGEKLKKSERPVRFIEAMVTLS